MYTHKPRTSAEIKADIAELRVADCPHDADWLDDLQSLLDELDEAVAAEPIPDKHAPTGGLDPVQVALALGGIPKEWDND